MTDRMTKKLLNARLDQLNDTFGMARDPYASERDESGRILTNDGTFVLDWAYGGVRLSQMCKGGGERDISGRGNMRECYEYMSAMLAGVYLYKKGQANAHS